MDRWMEGWMDGGIHACTGDRGGHTVPSCCITLPLPYILSSYKEMFQVSLIDTARLPLLNPPFILILYNSLTL